MKKYLLAQLFSIPIFILFCNALFLSSCNNKANNSEHQAANPFDTTQTAIQALNEEDRTKLLQAQGKKATITDNETLSNKIANSNGSLHIYCFWRMDDAESVKTVKAVNNLATQFDSTNLKVSLIHVSTAASIDNLNLFIRENQLTEENFILDKIDKSMMATKVKKDFLTAKELPIILVVNKAEGLIIFYNKSFDEQELKAVIQPFLL
jgi:hypothetical protein